MARPTGDDIRIPVEPFREHYLTYGGDAADIARYMGWERAKRKRDKTYIVADTTKAKRKLGLTHFRARGGKLYFMQTLSEDEALRLLPLFPALDPVDVGI